MRISILSILVLAFHLPVFAASAPDCRSYANGNEVKLDECASANSMAVKACQKAKDSALNEADQAAIRSSDKDNREAQDLQNQAQDLQAAQNGSLSTDQDVQLFQSQFSTQAATGEDLKNQLEAIKKKMDDTCDKQLQNAKTTDALMAINKSKNDGDEEMSARNANAQNKINTANSNYNDAGLTGQSSNDRAPTFAKGTSN